MRLVLYQPDIPQNTGAIMRLAACMGVPLDIVEPCGFPLDDSRLRRAGMDYIDLLELCRHASWEAFRGSVQGRIVLLTTSGPVRHTDFAFHASDLLLLGRESAGVPDTIHHAADARIRIPIRQGVRSLNVAQAAAIALAEALRQTGGLP